MGICTVDACVEQYYGKTDCALPVVNDPAVVVSCGTTTVVSESKFFKTREYTTYGDVCPGTFAGKEAVIGVVLPEDGAVTITVSDTSPTMDVALFFLGDWCNAATCEQVGTNTITISGLSGLNAIVLEASADPAPTGLTLTVGDCP
jgi:hypothetical protein